MGLLEHTPAPLSRDQFTPGHITCTGLVYHPEMHSILLIHHARLDRWLLPGGHVEPQDREPWHGARREVEEETTARLVIPVSAPLVGIDVHGIPPKKAEPFHQHHDLVFAFRAASAELVPTEEVRAAVWFRLDGLAANPYQIPENTRLCALRGITLLD